MPAQERLLSGRHWRRLSDGRAECNLCPRLCQLGKGERGYCRTRIHDGGGICFSPLGHHAGVRVEPIEAHALTHFFPGTLVLAVGKGGTNLASRFQWNGPSRDAPVADRLPDLTEPADIVSWARDLGCPSVALGCTEPTVMHEYAIEVARACRAACIKTVALSRGYVCPQPRAAFYRHIDAARVELLAFEERFYRNHCDGHIAPVKDTLAYLAQLEGVWLEVAVPLIPGENDTAGEIERFSRWFMDNLGADVPLHFRTSHLLSTRGAHEQIKAEITSARARRIAHAEGVRHVYGDDLSTPASRPPAWSRQLPGPGHLVPTITAHLPPSQDTSGTW